MAGSFGGADGVESRERPSHAIVVRARARASLRESAHGNIARIPSLRPYSLAGGSGWLRRTNDHICVAMLAAWENMFFVGRY